MVPNIRRIFPFFVVLLCGFLFFDQLSYQANAQENLSLPDQVLQATLLKMIPADTQMVVDSALLLEADESKDDSKSYVSLFPAKEESGAWFAQYKVVSTHPTGATHRDLPAFQGCHNDVEIIIINALIAPPGAILKPVFGNLSIADAAESGFATPEVTNELKEAGINVNQDIIGSQSFHGYQLNFLRRPNLRDDHFDEAAWKFIPKIGGYFSYLVWQQGEWTS